MCKTKMSWLSPLLFKFYLGQSSFLIITDLGNLYEILNLNVSAIFGARIPLVKTTFWGDQPAGKVAINCHLASTAGFSCQAQKVQKLSQKKKDGSKPIQANLYIYTYVYIYICTCIICILIYFLDINTTYNIYIYIYTLICKKFQWWNSLPTSQGRKKKTRTPGCWCFYVARWCHEHRVEAFQLPWRPGRSMAPSRWRSSRWRSPGVGVAQTSRCC